jgi:ribonucleoside-diphosphate reductase beta chain
MNVHPDKLFFGESGHGICRYDTIRYPILDKIDEKMKSFFWRPQEIDFSQEKRSFDKMTDAEQFIFTSNLKRQILLDSIQGRAPALTFLEHCTDPTLENAILTWSFFESIHSASYTYILRAIYPNPAEVVDDMPNIRPIVDCAHDITESYDRLRNNPNKENLYLALISANALEAIRFYVSFACTFAFMERGMVEASAKTIKMIARDENMHLVLVQHILKLLPQDDPEFVQIIGDNRKNATQIFMAAAEQEKEWARYLFENGTMLGLNEKILSNYIDYLLPRRMKAVKLVDSIPRIEHPLPWIEKHFTSENSQVAPQEVELSSYLASSVRNDLGDLNLQDLWVQ